jgi:hypothetical protein
MKGSLGTLEEKLANMHAKKKPFWTEKRGIMPVMKDERAVEGNVSRRCKIQRKKCKKGS